MASDALQPYIDLLSGFVERGLPAATFERRFLEVYKNDPTMFSDEEFLVLDGVFGDMHAFVAEDDLRDEGDLDEREPRTRCEAALARLRAWLPRRLIPSYLGVATLPRQ